MNREQLDRIVSDGYNAVMVNDSPDGVFACSENHAKEMSNANC